jgi:hypothetical protein
MVVGNYSSKCRAFAHRLRCWSLEWVLMPPIAAEKDDVNYRGDDVRLLVCSGATSAHANHRISAAGHLNQSSMLTYSA